MKRSFALIAAAVVAASALVGPSAASGTASLPVSGTLEGSAPGVGTFCTTGTMSVTGSFHATFIGSGTYSGTITTSACQFPPFCCGVPSEPYPVNATLVFAGPGGTFTASGNGTGVSTATPHFDSYEFDIQLSIDSGTHRYQRASGNLTLLLGASGPIFSPDPTTFSFGRITGAITPA